MGSLIDELQRREATAREEAEELRGRIGQLAERLAGVEERLSRLVITRETVEEVLNGSGAEATPATVVPDGAAPSRPGHLSAVGVLAVPPWRPGVEASVLPEAYRDLLEVAEDAGRPLRARPGRGCLPCRRARMRRKWRNRGDSGLFFLGSKVPTRRTAQEEEPYGTVCPDRGC